MKNIYLFTSMLALTSVFSSSAQLAKDNQCKFLGNIVASTPPANYSTYWNQVTPENATKWGCVEGTRGVYNWSGADLAYNYAKAKGYKFKYHNFVWGSQEPGWLSTGGLTNDEKKAELLAYMEAAAKRYPDVQYIDVVNEPTHAPSNMRDAIGGAGTTGYDWVVWSYKQARRLFPNAKLLINDYGIISDMNAAKKYYNIIKILKDSSLIDGIGLQCHQFNMNTVSTSTMTSVINYLATLGLPIYISELDMNGSTEAEQAALYKEKFPVMWENKNVAGVTLWGYVEGSTWITGTGLLNKDGTERAAMIWLKQYMATDAAKNATAYICGNTGTTPASEVTVSLASNYKMLEVGLETVLTATASTTSGTIAKVDFYDGDNLIGTSTSAPYTCKWTPTVKGTSALKAVATTSDGKWNTSDILALSVENFSMVNGALAIQTESMPVTGGMLSPYVTQFNGVAYYANAAYTQALFTVDQPGTQQYTVTVTGCSNNTTAASAELYIDNKLVKKLTWSTATASDLTATVNLDNASTHTVKLLLVDDNGQSDAYIDKISFKLSASVSVSLVADHKSLGVGESVVLTATATATSGTVSKVDFYAGSSQIGTTTKSPYTCSWTPSAKGSYVLKAVVTTAEGLSATSKTVTVNVVDDTIFNMRSGALTIQTESMPVTGGDYLGSYSGKFVGMVYYANGDYTQALFTVDQPGTQQYTVTVTGCSNNTTAASAELYIDNKLVKKLTWSTATASDLTATVNLDNASTHTVKLLLVDDNGQSDAYIDKISFKLSASVSVSLVADHRSLGVGESAVLTATATSGTVSKVDFYAGSSQIGTSTKSPYTCSWTPSAKGSYVLKAVVTTAEGLSATSKTVTVNVVDDTIFNMRSGALTIQTESMPVTGGDYLGSYSGKFVGMAYYANGDYTQALFTVDQPGTQQYTVTVTGCSNNTTAASAELYIDNKLVKKLTWSTASDLTATVNLDNASTHTVKLLLVDDNGQSDAYIDKISFKAMPSSTDMEEVAASSSVSVYPNPIHSELHIVGTANLHRAELVSADGKVVLTATQTDFNVSQLSSGFYLLRVFADDSISKVKVLIEK
jgi:endo-1,4-beta-xylanase